MRKMKAVETANQAYTRLQNDVGCLLDLAAQELKRHAEAQKADPQNWGRPGDLGEVKARLKQVLSFLMGGTDEEANDRAIENHLAEMRNQ